MLGIDTFKAMLLLSHPTLFYNKTLKTNENSNEIFAIVTKAFVIVIGIAIALKMALVIAIVCNDNDSDNEKTNDRYRYFQLYSPI